MDDTISFILQQIKTEAREGMFWGSWYLEGTKKEAEHLEKTIRLKLMQSKLKVTRFDCIRSLRWPTDEKCYQMGEPFGEKNQCFLLSLAVGITASVGYNKRPDIKKRK